MSTNVARASELEAKPEATAIMPPGGGRKLQGPSQLGGAAYGENNTSQVALFYDDREVFITGGTGFIGKVLLEKLLRSCPGLSRVYLLVRSKRGEEPQARLQKMFNSKMFERLKQEQPWVLEKVTAMAGDLSQPGLGLSAPDLATLVDNVSVVFHSGATVKFTEPLRAAFELNVLGTRRVLDICKQMSNIRALVHVSTAYCNCDRSDFHHEAINRPSENIRKYFEAFESARNYATGVNKECLFGHPNTYTLTKNFAESLVLHERGNIPVAIVRPSIVTAALSEPLPGWVDNYSACTGIVVGLGLGLLPSMITEKKHLTDIVPVDIVANTLICVAWHTSTRPTHVKVYHCASGTLQQHTWADMADAMQKSILRYPLPNAMCYPKFSVTNSHLWHNVNLYCLRYLPALVADLFLTLLKREPRFVKLYKKARKNMDVGEYFLTHGWLFTMDNVVKLAHDLTPRDKQSFNIDVRSMNWYPYWDLYLLGIRKYLFKAEDSDLSKAQNHLKRLYVLRVSLQALLFALACRLLTTRTAWNFGSTVMMLCPKILQALFAVRSAAKTAYHVVEILCLKQHCKMSAE